MGSYRSLKERRWEVHAAEVGRSGQVQVMFQTWYQFTGAYTERSDMGVRENEKWRMTLICDLSHVDILFTKLGKTGKGRG